LKRCEKQVLHLFSGFKHSVGMGWNYTFHRKFYEAFKKLSLMSSQYSILILWALQLLIIRIPPDMLPGKKQTVFVQ
jgi:hypothetical protein